MSESPYSNKKREKTYMSRTKYGNELDILPSPSYRYYCDAHPDRMATVYKKSLNGFVCDECAWGNKR